MAAAIDCMREMFPLLGAGEAINQPRRRMFLPTGAVLHSMAGAYKGYFGTKIYSTHPKHQANFTFLLYDAPTAAPLAQFEANHLGQIRTGAASGYAADILAPRHSAILAVIGTGFQAKTQVEAILAVRAIEEIRVWSRNKDRRERFAQDLSSEPGIRVRSAETAEQAVADAHIVVTATSAREPVLERSWVGAGAFIAAMGSNRPDRRELPADLVRSARLIADDVEACRIEAGDYLLALSDEDWKGVESLGKVKTGHYDRLTVFKSVGLGVEDVAVAAYIYEQTTPER